MLPSEDQSEYDKFLKLLEEEVGPKNPHGWQIKTDWAKDYNRLKFKMRVCLRNHESGNPNKLLRGDGKYQGVSPEDFLGFLLNPENLPGLNGKMLKPCQMATSNTAESRHPAPPVIIAGSTPPA